MIVIPIIIICLLTAKPALLGIRKIKYRHLQPLVNVIFLFAIAIVLLYVNALASSISAARNADTAREIRDSIMLQIEYEKECGYDEPSSMLKYVVNNFNNEYVFEYDLSIFRPFIPNPNAEYKIDLEESW